MSNHSDRNMFIGIILCIVKAKRKADQVWLCTKCSTAMTGYGKEIHKCGR